MFCDVLVHVLMRWSSFKSLLTCTCVLYAHSCINPYLAYVRRLVVEFNSIVWSPDTVKDIVALECVQRRFTKKLPGLFRSCYQDRLRRLQLPSLELRCLYADLVWCYKILFGIVYVKSDKFFEFNMRPSRGHQYKLYKNRSVSRVRAAFFSERVVNVCNSLPDSVDFSSLSKFRRSVMRVDFSKFLRCF